MKPIDQCSDEELLLLARRAQALQNAPPAWIDRAIALMPAAAPVGVGDVVAAGWRLLKAHLRFDSAAARPAGAVLSVRSSPSSEVRQLLFSAEGRDIDLRVALGPNGYSLRGQLLGPDEGGQVELRCGRPDAVPTQAGDGGISGPAQVTAVDDMGEFQFQDLPPGRCAMTLRLGRDAVQLPPFDLTGAAPDDAGPASA